MQSVRIDVMGTPYERLSVKYVINPETGCHEWTGTTRNGYGTLLDKGRKVYAHRVAYEHERGPIPDGLVIDHLCENKICLNVEHMEVVTIFENVRRGQVRNPRTHCRKGHERTPENTLVVGNVNRCRVCSRMRNRDYHQRKKAKAG